ncbi:MAG: exopolysaccharide biosynthesis polyprenyl glycosylphosphotransferase [Acidimicrobiales bacterium]
MQELAAAVWPWSRRLRESRICIVALFDMFSWAAGVTFALLVTIGFETLDFSHPAVIIVAVSVTLQSFAGWATGLYRRRWSIGSFEEFQIVGIVWAGVSITVGIGTTLRAHPDFGGSTLAVAAAFALALQLGGRAGWRRAWEVATWQHGETRPRAVVVGAGEGARIAIRRMRLEPDSTSPLPVAMVCDDRLRRNRRIDGVDVWGTIDELGDVVALANADVVVVATNLQKSVLEAVYRDASQNGIPVRRLRRSVVATTDSDLMIPTSRRLQLVEGEVDAEVSTQSDTEGLGASLSHEADRDTPKAPKFAIPTVLLILGDAIALNLGFGLGFLLRFGLDVSAEQLDGYLRAGPIVTLVFVAIVSSFDLYRRQRRQARNALRVLARPLFLSALASSTVVLFTRSTDFPLTVQLLGFALGGVLVLSWRVIAANTENKLRGRDRVLVVLDRNATEDSDQRETLLRVARVANSHVIVEGAVDYRHPNQIVGRAMGVDLVIITAAVPSAFRSELTVRLMSTGTKVFLIPAALDVALSTGTSSLFHTIEGIEVSDGQVALLTRTLKRTADLTVSLFGLVLSAPFMLAITAAIRRDSPGPALFRQSRVGRGGRPFTILKFRTMADNAESATGAVLATKSDPRVTRVGSFLRKTRLDELPQLWNVFTGEMSLIGPRPERPIFVNNFNETVTAYSRRFRVRPGMTGLAQVRAGYGATADEKLRFDLLYINQLSMLLDVRIAIQTLATIIDFSASEGVLDDKTDVGTLIAQLDDASTPPELSEVDAVI